MKNVLIRIFSTITLLTFLSISSFGQTISKIDFEELIDEMICDFTDLTLKEKKKQADYRQFKDQIKPNCNYYLLLPFLKDLKPTPVVTLEIVEIFHHEYKERYNSKATNQRLYNILISSFEEDVFKVFSQKHPNSFPIFKTHWEGELRERFMLNVSQDEAIIDDTIDATTSIDNEFQEIKNNPIENNAESPDDYYTNQAEEIESSNGLGNSLLLYGFLLLLLAYVLYLLYQRNKDAIAKKLTGTSKKPKPIKTKTNVNKAIDTKKSKGWLSSRPKKKTYAEKIAALQTLIQNQKNTFLGVKEDIVKMHHEINNLTEKAGFEVIEEHIKQLSEKLDEVEQKRKELILALDTAIEVEETAINEKEVTTDAHKDEALQDEDSKNPQTETIVESQKPETVTESNFSHEIPVIQVRKLSSPPDLFFMPVPNKDGSFDVENWTAKFEDTESVYRFEMINNYEAKFKFYNEKKTVRRAISGYDIYIKPVCKALNAFNTNATEIKTQVHGVVYRDGSTWKLKEKALVYYQ